MLLEASGHQEMGFWLKVLGADKCRREKTAERQLFKSMGTSCDWLNTRLAAGEKRQGERRSLERPEPLFRVAYQGRPPGGAFWGLSCE